VKPRRSFRRLHGLEPLGGAGASAQVQQKRFLIVFTAPFRGHELLFSLRWMSCEFKIFPKAVRQLFSVILGPTFELHEDEVRKCCTYHKELDLPLMRNIMT